MEEILEAAIIGGANDDEIEYIILNNVLINRDHVGNERVLFSLEEMSDEDIKLSFRFERDDIPRLVQLLGIPDEVITESCNKINGKTALCIVLKRLAYPNRLQQLCPIFGLSIQSLSQIIKKTITIIIERHGHILSNLNNLEWLNEEKMRYYAQAVHAKGAAVGNCWGFIDGTARQICRPSINQELYSGHKQNHCLKFQSVLCPDGIIASLKGAYQGRRHDAGIFRESMLYLELEQKAVFNGNERYCLYGDQAYGLMELLLTPYVGRPQDLLPHQQEFNRTMKVLRLSVEWGFQKVVSLFAFVDFKKNPKLLLQDLDSMYKVAVLLINCHTCLYGSQTAQYFQTVPPTLNEYFNVI